MAFSCLCGCHSYRNYIFRLYQQNKSSKSKVKFRQARNLCKRVLESSNSAHANKTKSPSLPRNLALGNFGELLKVFSTKVNLLYLLYLAARRCCLLHLIKQNCLLSLYLFSLLEIIGNCIIFLQLPRWLKRSERTLIHQRRLVLIVFHW